MSLPRSGGTRLWLPTATNPLPLAPSSKSCFKSKLVEVWEPSMSGILVATFHRTNRTSLPTGDWNHHGFSGEKATSQITPLPSPTIIIKPTNKPTWVPRVIPWKYWHCMQSVDHCKHPYHHYRMPVSTAAPHVAANHVSLLFYAYTDLKSMQCIWWQWMVNNTVQKTGIILNKWNTGFNELLFSIKHKNGNGTSPTR